MCVGAENKQKKKLCTIEKTLQLGLLKKCNTLMFFKPALIVGSLSIVLTIVLVLVLPDLLH